MLVTGTPGTGKSTLCGIVSERCFGGAAGFCAGGGAAAASSGAATKMRHIDVGKLVRARGLHSGWDAANEAFVLDEDALCDALEPALGSARGGVLLEAHSCDFFPERWFDRVVVLRADNTVLFDRLSARGYPQHKVAENVEAEIMQVVRDEAFAAYPAPGVACERVSDTVEQLEAIATELCAWIFQWVSSSASSSSSAAPAEEEEGDDFDPFFP